MTYSPARGHKVAANEMLVLAREDLACFCIAQWPPFQLRLHHRAIIDRLEAVERRDIRRLMLFLPPRHGKSLLTSQFFLAWYLGRHPDRHVIFTTYGQELSDDFGRRVRNLLADPLHQAIFPECALSEDSTAAHRFNTTAGGAYYAVGRGGPITGRGAHLLIIDDPLKDMEEAQSETIRRGLHEWYASVAYTRLQPGAAIVLIQTRWHQNDLAGWLLEGRNEPNADHWEVLLLPAENPEGGATIPTDLPPYEALWPTHYPVEALRTIKASIGSRAYSALYLQRPTPEEGGVIKRGWFRFYRERPAHFDEIIQSWDMAFKETRGSDFVVGQIWGRAGANKYLLDQVRARMDFPATISAVKTLSAKWPQAHAKLVEDKANGTAVIAALRNEIPGLIAVEPQGSKEARLAAASSDFEAGNVYVPDPSVASWVHDFIEELCAFPNGPHDDQCDAASQAINRLRQLTNGLFEWLKSEYEKKMAQKRQEQKPPASATLATAL